jgi:hypothetical protein
MDGRNRLSSDVHVLRDDFGDELSRYVHRDGSAGASGHWKRHGGLK